MNAQITFAFDLPEDEADYKIHLMADEMYDAIQEVRAYLRSVRKYSEKEPGFEEIDEKIIEILSKIPWV